MFRKVDKLGPSGDLTRWTWPFQGAWVALRGPHMRVLWPVVLHSLSDTSAALTAPPTGVRAPVGIPQPARRGICGRPREISSLEVMLEQSTKMN